MHEMTTDHVHEEIQLLVIDVSSMLFETLGPSRRGATTTAPTTRRRTTGTCGPSSRRSDLRGGRRWVLKSPQHLEQLPVLGSVFPGATVVVTHRDPVPVTISMLTMLCYSARMHRSPVDPPRSATTGSTGST